MTVCARSFHRLPFQLPHIHSGSTEHTPGSLQNLPYFFREILWIIPAHQADFVLLNKFLNFNGIHGNDWKTKLHVFGQLDGKRKIVEPILLHRAKRQLQSDKVLSDCPSRSGGGWSAKAGCGMIQCIPPRFPDTQSSADIRHDLLDSANQKLAASYHCHRLWKSLLHKCFCGDFPAGACPPNFLHKPAAMERYGENQNKSYRFCGKIHQIRCCF